MVGVVLDNSQLDFTSPYSWLTINSTNALGGTLSVKQSPMHVVLASIRLAVYGELCSFILQGTQGLPSGFAKLHG